MRSSITALVMALALTVATAAEDLSQLPFPIWNVVPPLEDSDDGLALDAAASKVEPIAVPPFEEHVRRWLPSDVPAEVVKGLKLTAEGLVASNVGGVTTYNTTDWTAGEAYKRKLPVWYGHGAEIRIPERAANRASQHQEAFAAYTNLQIWDAAALGDEDWLATSAGLFRVTDDTLERHPSYGVDGPLATNVTAIAADSSGALWTGSPVGIAVREPDGSWRAIRGRNGLPVEDITAIAVDGNDDLWIGTSHGLIQHRPNAEDRQWYYRESERYLPHNYVHDVAITPDNKTIYTATKGGIGQLDIVETTLLERAHAIEENLNARHRRLGMVADADLNDPVHPTSWDIPDDDNDGLWTAYHVAALSLAFSVTGDPDAKASAMESMHALYMLQNVSGIPGLPARTVLPKAKAIEIGKDKNPQWRLTDDGTMYWKSDTSSDEIDGHYLAFFTYWEHIAKNDPDERERCIEQVRTLTNYIVDNDYLLIDWDGEHTRWGFWTPRLLNNDPRRYLENGLNSLQILSFLKTAYHITGDEKFQQHYMKLITEHHYLANVLLQKRTYPDSDNHSDNQLGYVAWYPILQTEQDPEIRRQLRKAVRRHYKIINRDRSSFFYFVTATVDPGYVDLEAAVLNLKRIPTDRRQWKQRNSHRADVIFDPRVDRFGDAQLMSVLPVDERTFGRWNRNPYLPDWGRTGLYEDSGSGYLLPYWLARYHGFIE